MELVFLGTRGYIEPIKRGHRMHTVTLVRDRGTSVAFDCVETWRGSVETIEAEAIFVTHAHLDHVGALVDGAPCPVYATRASWDVMRGFAIAPALRRTIEPRTPIVTGALRISAFPVVHSERAPAVGFRIEGQRTRLFYAPDVLEIVDRCARRGTRDRRFAHRCVAHGARKRPRAAVDRPANDVAGLERRVLPIRLSGPRSGDEPSRGGHAARPVVACPAASPPSSSSRVRGASVCPA